MDVVTRLKTFRPKEFCCGCTLRTGALILLWIVLIFDSIGLIWYLREIVYGKYFYASGVKNTVMKIRAYYFFLWSTVGVITSLYGLFGVQKNIPRYLTYSYYYFLYYVAFVFLCAIVVLANPNWHRNYIMADGYLAYGSGSELTLIVFIMYVFAGAILSYFAIIVRSCRDTMEKNQANNQFNAMPDPATSGYNVA
ncbi:uncharacterized protein LOC135834663 isoform X2 [Planococcus citri]|uniref:uncharacterized protein LOC135834663 isoform X2 n=1 Tax=Planococcus citri TaxID=170843 RepID=UPI0031F723BE